MKYIYEINGMDDYLMITHSISILKEHEPQLYSKEYKDKSDDVIAIEINY